MLLAQTGISLTAEEIAVLSGLFTAAVGGLYTTLRWSEDKALAYRKEQKALYLETITRLQNEIQSLRTQNTKLIGLLNEYRSKSSNNQRHPRSS